MKYNENICNCLRVIQQNKNRKLKSDNCWQRTSAVNDRIWQNFELIQDFMVVLIICKNEEDQIKIKAIEYEDNQNQTRKSGNTFFLIISIWGFFSKDQGQLTPQSVVRYGRTSNSSELSDTRSLKFGGTVKCCRKSRNRKRISV